jgi:hypothetical protein
LFKLYKRGQAGQLLYHEAWSANTRVVEHWGVCGERSETKDYPVSSDSAARRTLKKLEKSAAFKGYSSIPEENMVFPVIEYPIEGHGSTADLDRRHALEDAFNELVGWLGLGHLDGGSIGSGTMEVALRVVDFDIAKSAVEANAAGTKLIGFNRIYRE